VIVDDVVREDATLSLRQEEQWEFLVKLALRGRGLMWVMDVEDASGEAGAHFTTVVAVHA